MEDISPQDTSTKPEDLGLPSSFDLDGFTNQVKRQYSRGYDATKSIRDEILEEDGAFHDQRANRDRINDYSFFTVHSALMARIFIDHPYTTFDNIGPGIMGLVAENLNNAYATDMDTVEFSKMEYQKSHDTFKCGAGTVLRDGWDAFNCRPTFTNIDPMMIIPDPDGDYVADNYNFWGAEAERFKEEFPENYLKKGVDRLVPKQTELSQKKSERKTNDGLQNTWDLDRLIIYYTFTYFEYPGKGQTLFFAVYGNERNEPLLIQPIFPELPEEKHTGIVKISKFVAVDRWKPTRDSYFGHRLAIFCLNVQDAKALMATLRFMKSKAELYPMYLANARHIQDRTDLDFGFNKIVFVNPLEGESIDKSVMPMQKDFRADNSYLVDNSLDSQLSRVTGGMAGNLVSGQETQRRETLGTNQLQQDNTDTNLSLTTKLGTWFAQTMAWSWYRGYVENMKDGDDKLVQLETGMGSKYIKMKKRDLIQKVSFNIKVRSAFEVDKDNKETYLRLSQLLAQSATVAMSESEKRGIIREMAVASGISQKKVDSLLGVTPQEQLALDENLSLAENVFVPIHVEDDDRAHIRMHKDRGLDTTATVLHISSHAQAYIAKGGAGSAMTNPDMNAASLQQSMAGQSMANQMAKSNGQLGGTM